MRTLFLVCFLATTALAQSARADWQNTTWSMQRDEVIRATGAKAAEAEPGREVFNATLGAVGTYEALGFTFDSEFYFDRAGGLRVVRLMLSDAARCDELRTTMQGIYGTPVEDRPSSVRWMAPLENNSVRFTAAHPPISTKCFLAYTPILSSGSSGL